MILTLRRHLTIVREFIFLFTFIVYILHCVIATLEESDLDISVAMVIFSWSYGITESHDWINMQ